MFRRDWLCLFALVLSGLSLHASRCFKTCVLQGENLDVITNHQYCCGYEERIIKPIIVLPSFSQPRIHPLLNPHNRRSSKQGASVNRRASVFALWHRPNSLPIIPCARSTQATSPPVAEILPQSTTLDTKLTTNELVLQSKYRKLKRDNNEPSTNSLVPR